MELDNNAESWCVEEENSHLQSEEITKRLVKNFLNMVSYVIRIYVYQPYVRIRHIKLNSFNSISVLSRIYPQDSIYIFNGQILDISKSFHYYKISNDNKIVLISSLKANNDASLVEKWKKITSDHDNFEERVNLNINESSRKELARVKDLKLYKLEMKRKSYGKYIRSQNSNQSNINQNNKIYDDIKLNTSYNSIETPSTEALPIIW